MDKCALPTVAELFFSNFSGGPRDPKDVRNVLTSTTPLWAARWTRARELEERHAFGGGGLATYSFRVPAENVWGVLVPIRSREVGVPSVQKSGGITPFIAT